MSFTTIENSENTAHFGFDVSKVFVHDNRFEGGTFLNDTGVIASFVPGTVLGRIAASELLVVLDAGAADGSQFPVGILKTEITDLGIAGNAEINFCISGDVVQDKIVFVNAETLATIVSLKTLADRIKSDTQGIKLVESTEQTAFDNQ